MGGLEHQAPGDRVGSAEELTARRMRRLILPFVSILSAVLPAPSLACGVCVEDKIAATYDHAVVTRARAQGHLVVFGEISGAVDMKVLVERLPPAAARVHGIDRGTVRASAAPPAFSFALDPAARTPESAVADLQRRVRTQGAILTVLRVVSGDAPPARD
jgi:hypothetical protein